MPHGEAHEEAEHAEHHSHDPFTKHVALSMVVIAAVLAGVKVLGHRAHNNTLDYRIQASDKRTQADTLHTKAVAASTEASNKWAYSQAKKLRQHYYEVSADLVQATSKDGAGNGKVPAWKDNVDKYAKEAAELQKEARELEAQKMELQAKGDEVGTEALELEHKSVHAHHKGDRYDLGEMGVELGLVVCSVAILVKRTAFWYGGMVLGGVGAILALLGLMY
jgi:hypothetical protein